MALLTINQLAAQTIITSDPLINNRVYLRAGIEPATMLTIGYERQFPIAFLKRDMVAFTELGSSVANFNNNEYGISDLKLTFDDTTGIGIGDFNFRYGNSNSLSSWVGFSPLNFNVVPTTGTEAILSWTNPLIDGWLEVEYNTGLFLYFGNLVGDANLDGYLTPMDALTVIDHINDGHTYFNQYDINGDGSVSPVDALRVSIES